MKTAERVYLDVCCLNRPFDDQSQPRIHLEAEAVILILEQCELRRWRQVSSEVSRVEILAISDEQLRRNLLRLLPAQEDIVYLDASTEARSHQLARLGFKPVDALHLAAAELAADVFLTCDDRLLKTARRVKRDLRVPVDNPLAWLEAQK